MKFKGQKYGRKTNKTLKVAYGCRGCKNLIKECSCWTQETDALFHSAKKNDTFDRREALKRRPGY